MAHFMELDENNKVKRIIVVANEDCGGGNFPDSEPIGQLFIASLGLEGNWKQTSYNANFRGNYGSVEYLTDNTDFVAPIVEEQ